MARRRRRIEQRIDLRNHEIAQRACIERARRQCKSRLRHAGAPEIRDQRLDQVHAHGDRGDAPELRIQGQQHGRPAAAGAIQPVRIFFLAVLGPRRCRRLGLTEQLFCDQPRRQAGNGREAQPCTPGERHARQRPLASQDIDETAAVGFTGRV
ncbi:hypothetical protein ACVWZ6_003743 [Bradyrhizobium sp. GM6.1]